VGRGTLDREGPAASFREPDDSPSSSAATSPARPCRSRSCRRSPRHARNRPLVFGLPLVGRSASRARLRLSASTRSLRCAVHRAGSDQRISRDPVSPQRGATMSNHQDVITRNRRASNSVGSVVPPLAALPLYATIIFVHRHHRIGIFITVTSFAQKVEPRSSSSR